MMKIPRIIGGVFAVLFGWIAFMAADNQPPYEFDAPNSYVIPSPAHTTASR